MSYPIWHPFTQMAIEKELPKVTSAKGALLQLENGKELIDLISSWWVTLHGHAEKSIAEAIYQQANILEQVIFANFTHDGAHNLAKRLTDLLPRSLSKVFFSDNGSTSVEVALKMAYQYWHNLKEKKRTSFICFEGGYHGDTVGAMSASGKGVFTDLFHPLMFSIKRVPFPEIHEGILAEDRSLTMIDELLKKSPDSYAAVMIEPLIQGAAGMRFCSSSFLRRLRDLVINRTLLIFDEVMVGFGRTGELFACQKSAATPDIICLAKGLTGGFLPMSVTVCTEEIYRAFHSEDPLKTFFHGHSYTANPLGCAAANASLDLLEKRKAYLNIEPLHQKYSKNLSCHPKVHNFRICGTIAAMNITPDGSGGYLDPVCKKIQKRCFEKGVFLRPLGDVLYLIPPYCITEEQIAYSYETILSVLSSP